MVNAGVSIAIPYPGYGSLYALRSHALARTTPDFSNHPALGIRPPPPLWLARVAGFFDRRPPTYRIACELSWHQKKKPLLLHPVTTPRNSQGRVHEQGP